MLACPAAGRGESRRGRRADAEQPAIDTASLPVTYLRAQACNNALANRRLLGACAALDDAELGAPRTGFFPSLAHTLNHVLTVDWFYVSALEGACVGHAAFDPEIPCPRLADLAREQHAVDRRLVTLCDALDGPGLARIVRLERPGWTQRERADRVLLHLFQHQVHHRGQAHAMLAALGFDEGWIWR